MLIVGGPKLSVILDFFSAAAALKITAALLGEAYRVCVVARKDFKKRVNQRGGALPTCVGFWLAAEDFRHTDPKDAGFAYACKRIFKAYIRPPAKLLMLTQGVRKDIEDAINDPQENMYAAAQN